MYQLTRRKLLQTGMGAVVGAAAAQTPAFAARRRGAPLPAGDGRYVGEIRLFPGTYVPDGWLACDGEEFNVYLHPKLHELIGSTYGSGSSGPRLPDLRGRTAVGAGDGPGQPHRSLGDQADSLAAKGEAPAGLGLRYMISPTGGEGEQLLAEIRALAFHYAPEGWSRCTGERIELAAHVDVFSLLGDTYGGDGRTYFLTPNLAGRSVLGVGEGAGLPEVGLGEQIPNLDPGDSPHSRRLHLNYCIALNGLWPSRPNHKPGYMLPTMIGELRAFSSAEVPEGWLPCHGQLLSIRDHQAMFALLGTAYGGNGRDTFGVPDLRGRAIAGTGDVGARTYFIGDSSAHPPASDHGSPLTLPFNTITWGIAGDGFTFPPRG
jgi:microcystin-dependent protein